MGKKKSGNTAKSAPTVDKTARAFALKLSKFSPDDRKQIVKSAVAMLKLAAKLGV